MLKTAADLMRTRVITISPHASLEDLALLLEEERIHGVPVVDSAGLPIGVVSRTDLVEALTTGERALEPTSHYYALEGDEVDWDDEDAPSYSSLDGSNTVGDIMSPRLVKAQASATVGQLARQMAREGVHRVLITDGRRLAGIVSVSDILRSVDAMERAIKKLGGASARAKPAAGKTAKKTTTRKKATKKTAKKKAAKKKAAKKKAAKKKAAKKKAAKKTAKKVAKKKTARKRSARRS